MKRFSLISAPAAFSLVEVTVALGIAAFCLVAIFGMLPVGLASGQNTAAQTLAVNVLSAVAADLRDAPRAAIGSATISESPFYGFKVPDAGGTTVYLDDSGSVTTQGQARFRVNVVTVFQPEGGGRSATRERVVISWPAPAAKPTGSVESIVALDRN